jgi:glycosyltransferase involved in cell wall biosynthesis
MPLYNKEEFVVAAINSVLGQTYQNFEIIVVDDGSKDRGAELVASIQDARIRLIKQVNSGVSQARNCGINESKGELVFFLDADDWYGKTYLETMVLMARRHPPGYFFAAHFKAVYSYRPEEWESAGKDVPTTAPPCELVTNFYERRYRIGPFVHTNSVVVWRQDLIQFQPCFPVGESLGEDQDLWFRLADRLQLVYCPLKLVAYRYGVSDGLCTTIGLRSVPPAFIRLEQRARRGQIKPFERQFAFLIAADARIQVARFLLANDQRINAIREVLKAWRAFIKKSWWFTLVMCGIGTPAMMTRWSQTRIDKLQIK